LDRGIRWRADDLERSKNLIAFDELAHLLDCLWRIIGIVVLDEIDLTPIDSALIVYHADIIADCDAVKAAILHSWSNGQTEGQITKLKLVKRQMYGRAKLDLLEARLIGAA
jgi:hypothetical protein